MELTPTPPSVIPAEAGTHVTPHSIPSWNRDKEEDSPVIPAALLFVIPAQAGTHVTPRSNPSHPLDHSSVRPERSETVTLPARPGMEVSPSHEVEGPPPPSDQADHPAPPPVIPAALLSVIPVPLFFVIPAQAGTHVTPRSNPRPPAWKSTSSKES